MNENEAFSFQLLGSLSANLKEVSENIREIKNEIKEIKIAHHNLQQEVANYVVRGETVARLFKWGGAFVIAVITLKFGDVKSLWASVFGR